MKKTFLTTSLLILSLFLGACTSASQSASASGNPTQRGTSRNTAGGSNPSGELPMGLELALGTFALDNTSTPIDSAEAAKLLFLWQGMNSLLQSQTTASEEVQGLIKQIQDTMTPEQVQAIKNMHLTYQDMQRIGQEAGVQLGGGGQFGNISPSARSTFQAQQGSQGGGDQGAPRIPGFGGGPGGGAGGGFGGGGGSGRTGSANTQVRTVNAFQGTGLNEPMVGAVIHYLQTKAK